MNFVDASYLKTLLIIFFFYFHQKNSGGKASRVVYIERRARTAPRLCGNRLVFSFLPSAWCLHFFFFILLCNFFFFLQKSPNKTIKSLRIKTHYLGSKHYRFRSRPSVGGFTTRLNTELTLQV